MSTTPDSTASTATGNRKPPAAGRYLFLLVLGLVIGVIATVMALRALDARKDHAPDSLMTMQGWHMGQLDDAIKGNRCAATDTLPHLQALRTLANDLEPVFKDLSDDQRFRDHASKYRAALDSALANPPISCAAAQTAMKDIGGACKACHQDFKGS